MKVIVFGATGTIGQNVVNEAIGKGHQVTAFCRSKSKMPLQRNLTIALGDVTNLNDVNAALPGHDAVIVVLGSGNQRTGTVRSVGTRNVIQAMKAHKITRLICQTTLGCGESKGNLNFFWKNIMFGWYLKGVFLDHEVQEELVRKSGLEWTIIRPAAFTNGPKTETYKHGFTPQEKSITLKISRMDVADFILKELTNNKYLHKTPGLSY